MVIPVTEDRTCFRDRDKGLHSGQMHSGVGPLHVQVINGEMARFRSMGVIRELVSSPKSSLQDAMLGQASCSRYRPYCIVFAREMTLLSY